MTVGRTNGLHMGPFLSYEEVLGGIKVSTPDWELGHSEMSSRMTFKKGEPR